MYREANPIPKRFIVISLSLVLVALLAGGSYRVANAVNCGAPIFVARNSAVLGDPTPSLASAIQLAGGLPKAGGEFHAGSLDFTSHFGINSVASWDIQSLNVSDPTPLHSRLLDDDPTYAITMDVDVHYTDGSSNVLRWTTWRYGLVLCPIVIPYGDGPQWTIRPVRGG